MSDTPENPSLGQSHVFASLENMLLARRPVKELEVLIFSKLDPQQKRLVMEDGVGPFEITALAIDALGESDPQFLKDIYAQGGEINFEVLYDLSTAIIRSRRTKRDQLEIFKEIQARNK